MADPFIGKMLGQYQIVGLAGKGGMATVYQAYQPSLNRYVALKVLPEYLAQDDRFVARFRREALSAAALRHPNILVIHDVGQEGNLHYIAMEYLEGETLSGMIRRTGGLSPAQALKIFSQLASALEFAHQRGLIHRDIKPANIFLGSGGHVTLVDFGIVKALAGAGLTSTGTMVGTPEYMSPEQISGQTIDLRSDLYSLGVVLYEMLTGSVPFSGDTPSAILMAHVNKPPTPPSRLTAFVTPPVEAVILKALEKNPRDRFGSAAEMARALEEAVTGRGTTASARSSAGEQTAVQHPLPAVAPPVQPQRQSAGWLVPVLAGIGALALLVVIGGILLGSGLIHLDDNVRRTPTAMGGLQQVALTTSTLAPTPTSSVVPTQATPTQPPATSTPAPVTATAVTPTSTPTTSGSGQVVANKPATTQPAPTTRPGTLFDFEAMGAWRRGDQANGTLAQSADRAHSGKSSARLDYSFGTAGNDFVVFMNEAALSGQPNAIGAWVYGDGSGHFLNAWIKDSAGEIWQAPLGRVGGSEWRQMSGVIATGQEWPWAHIDGPDNGKVDYPIRFYALVLDDRPDSATGKGTIYIDDVSVWRTDAVPTPVPQTPGAAATPGSASTPPGEPRAVTLLTPMEGATFKSGTITFKWSGGALQPGESFQVDIMPYQVEKGGCTTDYGSGGHQYSPALTAHEWTTDIGTVRKGQLLPCAGRIEWIVYIKDASGAVIQTSPRWHFIWNPL